MLCSCGICSASVPWHRIYVVVVLVAEPRQSMCHAQEKRVERNEREARNTEQGTQGSSVRENGGKLRRVECDRKTHKETNERNEKGIGVKNARTKKVGVY